MKKHLVILFAAVALFCALAITSGASARTMHMCGNNGYYCDYDYMMGWCGITHDGLDGWFGNTHVWCGDPTAHQCGSCHYHAQWNYDTYENRKSAIAHGKNRG